jgi:rod shape determining protein RodA
MFKDISLSISVIFLITLSVFILNSVAPGLFPSYIIYIVLAFFCFWFFSQIGFEVIALFSTHLYVLSIFLLVVTLIIGQVTHGTVRWIPIGNFTLQPSEIARPFLLLFFATYLTKQKVTLKRFLKAALLVAIPTVLILVQPSLGVSILTMIGFLGVLIASDFNKKYLLLGVVGLAVLIPIFWQIMAPYQRQRLTTFLEPTSDPLGAGYNSIQSVVAAGAGQFFGKGLGKGTQTQLSFLPEKQTDFIFAAVGEELGFVGTTLMLAATFIVLFRLTKFMENSTSPAARAYLSGFFLTYLIQIFVHTGMNMGIFPVTGIPYPLVSAGGSSLLATMMALGIALGAYKKL